MTKKIEVALSHDWLCFNCCTVMPDQGFHFLVTAVNYHDAIGICPAFPPWLRAHPLRHLEVSDEQVLKALGELNDAGAIRLFSWGDQILFATRGWDQVRILSGDMDFRHGPKSRDEIKNLPSEFEFRGPVSLMPHSASADGSSQPDSRDHQVDRCPFSRILQKYHGTLCPPWPRVRNTRSKELRASVKAVWQEHRDLDWWQDYFNSVMELGGNSVHNLKWLLTATGRRKIYERQLEKEGHQSFPEEEDQGVLEEEEPEDPGVEPGGDPGGGDQEEATPPTPAVKRDPIPPDAPMEAGSWLEW